MDIKNWIKAYGTVVANGKTYVILKNPYISSELGYSGYYESVVRRQEECEDCEDYQECLDTGLKIFWKIVNDDCEDGSDACNWEDFEIRGN